MCRRFLLLAAVTALAGVAPRIAHAQSPFAPNGPLAPWSAPLPSRTLPAQPSIPYAHTTAVPFASSSQPAAPVPGNARVASPDFAASAPPSAYTGWAPIETLPQPWSVPSAAPSPSPAADARDMNRTRGARDSERIWVSALVNPVLAPWGRVAGRIEIAPLAAHALYFEFSKIDFYITNLERQVPVYEYDLGYHLFPQGRGVSGFYLGPRLILARGETDEGVGKATGIGGDLGYQFVIAGHLVINAGIGAAHFTASAEAKPGYIEKILQGISSEEASAFGASLSFGQSVDFWLPLATLGIGAAF